MKPTIHRRTRQPRYSVQKKTRRLYVVMALLGALMLAASLGTGSSGAGASTLTTVFLVLAVWSHRGEPFRLHRDRLEFRASPLAALHVIGYDEIERIDDTHPKKTKLHLTPAGGRPRKPVRMPLGLLTHKDGEALLRRLDELTAA